MGTVVTIQAAGARRDPDAAAAVERAFACDHAA
jgi:hypothetical protein